MDDSDDERASGEELLFGLDFASLRGATSEDLEHDHDPFNGTDNENETTSPSFCGDGPNNTWTSLVNLNANCSQRMVPAQQIDFEELFEWASSQGARLDGLCHGQDDYGGRCLKSVVNFQEGENLGTLPRSLRLGRSQACRMLGLPPSTPDLSALTLLVLHLTESSHPYARCLPRREEFTNGILMSANEALRWGNIDATYASAIQKVRSIRDASYGYVRDVLGLQCPEEPPEIYSWALSMVKSRSHGLGSHAGFWLTPVFDLVNHSVNPNAKLVATAEGQLALQALRPILENEEIKIDYQVYDDAKLLAVYGFSLSSPR